MIIAGVDEGDNGLRPASDTLGRRHNIGNNLISRFQVRVMIWHQAGLIEAPGRLLLAASLEAAPTNAPTATTQ